MVCIIFPELGFYFWGFQKKLKKSEGQKAKEGKDINKFLIAEGAEKKEKEKSKKRKTEPDAESGEMEKKKTKTRKST